ICKKTLQKVTKGKRTIPKITFITQRKKGKRNAIVLGLKQVKTKLVVLMDDDVRWIPVFLQKMIAPFQQHKKIGAVGCKQSGRVRSPLDFLGIISDMGLSVRTQELMATSHLNKSATCVSGRTACYRTDILKCDE